MIDQPLSSGDHAKLLTFILIFFPAVIFLAGIVPAMLLAFGIYSMKKNRNFSNLEATLKVAKGYIAIAMGLIVFLININEYMRSGWSSYQECAIVGLVISGVATFYVLMVNLLFDAPLRAHYKWIEVNGVFSSTPRGISQMEQPPELDIIKSEKLKQYSVADELIKWAKLKEGGHITETEFNEARIRLLQRAQEDIRTRVRVHWRLRRQAIWIFTSSAPKMRSVFRDL